MAPGAPRPTIRPFRCLRKKSAAWLPSAATPAPIAIHLHVRDGGGAHILDADLYRQAIAEIRSQAGPDIVNQVTTEAVGRYQPDQQMVLVRELRPEAFSVAVREILPEGGQEAPAADFLAWCHDRSIAAQYILYDPADLRRFADFARRGIIPGDRLSVLFVLGPLCGQPGKRSQRFTTLSRRAGGSGIRRTDRLDGLRLRTRRNRLRHCRPGARRTCTGRL